MVTVLIYYCYMIKVNIENIYLTTFALLCTCLCVLSILLEINKVPVACMGETPTNNVISCESGSQISILDLVFGVNRLDCPSSQCCFNSTACETPAWYLNETYLNQTRAECDGRRLSVRYHSLG